METRQTRAAAAAAFFALLLSCGSVGDVPLSVGFANPVADGSSPLRALTVESEPGTRGSMELRITSTDFTGNFTLQWFVVRGADILTTSDPLEFTGLYFHNSLSTAAPPPEPPTAGYIPPAAPIVAGQSENVFAIIDPADCSVATEAVVIRVLVLTENGPTSDFTDLFVEVPPGPSCP